jgi:2,4-diketo-3-deoxy-L-fuconate hydrolase
MRFANHGGRLVLLSSPVPDDLNGAGAIDVHDASGGRIPADPALAFGQWDEVVHLAAGEPAGEDVVIESHRLGSPSPRPLQIFGIGINYADHGAEAGMETPEIPLVFTKLQTAVTGPFNPIELPTLGVDWEVEVAVVMGRMARNVAPEQVWPA